MGRIFHTDDKEDLAMLELMVRAHPKIKLQYFSIDGDWMDRIGNYYRLYDAGKETICFMDFPLRTKYRLKPESDHE